MGLILRVMRRALPRAILIVLSAIPVLAQEPPSRAAALAAVRGGDKDPLHQLSDTIEALSHKVSLSVVQVFSTGYAIAEDEPASGDGTIAGLVTKQRSSGSGVILSANGDILTNNHVVENARRVCIQLASASQSAHGIAKLLPETRKAYGVIVAARTGDAEYPGQGGLKLGDVIYSVNTTPVSTLEALRNAVDGLKTLDPVVLQIERDSKLMYLTLSEE